MVLRESSQWFWNFINKTIHHVDWFERSSPSSTYLRAPWPTRSLWRLTTWKNKLKLTIKIWLGISVTRWLDYLFHIWPFTKMKCCPIPFKFCQKGSKFCQILNEPFQNWYSFFVLCQSGEILPSLITLLWMSKLETLLSDDTDVDMERSSKQIDILMRRSAHVNDDRWQVTLSSKGKCSFRPA